MFLRKKAKSSHLLPRSSPRKASIAVGHGVPKSQSGLNTSIYKPVVTGGDEPLILWPSKRQETSSPAKHSSPSSAASAARSDHSRSVRPISDVSSAVPDPTADSGKEDGAGNAEARQPAVPVTCRSPPSPVPAPKSPVRASVAGIVDLSEWGLPTRVVSAYRKVGVTTMFPWQAECLNRGNVMDGKNLVYSAPTSAGKTLVAEILLLKRVVETRKKGLFILPFVALAREKMVNLQRIFKGSGIRIGGYMGHVHPPGGLALLDIAVCTIEKANSLINKMVSEKKLGQLGVIVVDELHMVGDRGRGYLIELLLTKVQYLNQMRAAAEQNEVEKFKEAIQIVGMSATLPNLDLVAKWLDADLYTTDYRPVPLQENVKLGSAIYDKKWQKVRDVPILSTLQNDPDHIVSLCYETVSAGHGVLMFCPFKNWCETLAEVVSKEFSLLLAACPSAPLVGTEKTADVVQQLRESPAGLDKVLARTVPFGVAFHHAGLTMDEREIIETAFRKGYLKVLIATTTLSSGVNLPARRVIIRSPLFMNEIMDVLTYYQMAGRAGRKGVDTEGECILMCKDNEKAKAMTLFASSLRPVKSCLTPFVNGKVCPSMIRAILEVIVNGAANSVSQVADYLDCTLFSAGMESFSSRSLARTIVTSLMKSELVLSPDDEALRPSQLGNAVVWSGLSPGEGFAIFQELDKARLQFNLETELHVLYLVTPLHLLDQLNSLDWYHYLALWERLPVSWKRVGMLVGVEEKSLAAAVRGRLTNVGDSEVLKQITCLKRFYCALILNELVHEVSLAVVAHKYQVNKGVLQSLQQGASTYSGMITIFCQELGWLNMHALFEQFQSRLMFGVQRDLIELIRIQFLTARQARLLYQAGYPNLATLATAEKSDITDILINSAPFDSNANGNVQKSANKILLNGLEPMTEEEAAGIIKAEARRLLENDMEAVGFRLVSTKESTKAADPNDATADATGEDVLSDVRDELKTQKAVEFSEIESTQWEVDEPLDAALQAADDVLQSQRMESSEKIDLELNLTGTLSVRTAVEALKLSDNTESLSRESPDRVDASDSEEDVPTQRNARSVSTFQEYVVSYTSEEKYLTSQAPPVGRVIPGNWRRNNVLPSILEPGFADFLDNFQSPRPKRRSIRTETPENPSEKTPLCQPKSAHEETTPVLFVTPGPNGKRKITCDESFGDRPAKKCVGETSCFDMDTRIDFNDDVAQGSPEKERFASSPPRPSGVDGVARDLDAFRIITVTDSPGVFSQFLVDWREQTTFSLSLACEKLGKDTVVRIGPPRVGGTKKIFYGLHVPLENKTIVGMAVAWSGKTAHYICLSDRPKSCTDLDAVTCSSLSVEARLAAVRDVLVDLSQKSVIMFDLKRQLHMLLVAFGMPVSRAKFFDPKIAVWLLDMGSDERTLQMIVAEKCPALLTLLEDVKSYRGHGSLGSAVSVPLSARVRSAIDCVVSRILAIALSAALRCNGLLDLFESVEMPIIPCLVAMELNGFGFSMDASKKLLTDMQTQLDLIEQRIFSLARRKFQLSSSDAVGQVLFVDLRIPPPPEAIQSRQTRGKTKTYYSTNKEILGKIQHHHALPSLILEYRRLQSALSKFIFPIQKAITTCSALNMDRICGLCFTCSVTGRISMAEPSLQCIPKDFAVDSWMGHSQSQGRTPVLMRQAQTKLRVSLRSSFVPFSGGVLLSADYSQLELRVMAHLAEDRTLTQVLADGGDVFNLIASQWRKIDISKVSPEERQQAKKICYGIIYGMGAKALAEQLEVSDNEAELFMASFKSAYPAVDSFIKTTVERCRQTGYVQTLCGCRRYLPNISSMKNDLRTQAERQAVNTTVQGSATNLAKAALVKIDAELRNVFPHSMPHQLRSQRTKEPAPPRGAYLVLQLHDEFIFEVHSADLDAVAEIVERHMRTAVQLRVPLRVNTRVGPSWGALSPYRSSRTSTA